MRKKICRSLHIGDNSIIHTIEILEETLRFSNYKFWGIYVYLNLIYMYLNPNTNSAISWTLNATGMFSLVYITQFVSPIFCAKVP